MTNDLDTLTSDHDHDTFVELIQKQRELLQLLEVNAQELLMLAGRANDHTVGVRHRPETCTTCAACEQKVAAIALPTKRLL